MKKYPYVTRTWGYARVSTEDQDLRHQLQALKEYGCDEIFEEKQSGKDMKREQLDWLKFELQPGDKVVVTKLDRLGRNLVELEELVSWLEENEIELVCLHQPVDFKSANGRMMFRMMAAFAQMESELASERTKAGMEAARKAGKQVGAITKREKWERDEPGKAKQMLKDIKDPALSMNSIAKKYEISLTTLRNNWMPELRKSGKTRKK